MRARGWLAGYSVGNDSPKAGVPVASAFSFDTGVQVTSAWRLVTLSGAVTNGTLSNPRVGDDNGGKQLQARVTVRPSPGLEIGSSFARGSFVSRTVLRAFDPPPSDSFVQQSTVIIQDGAKDFSSVILHRHRPVPHRVTWVSLRT